MIINLGKNHSYQYYGYGDYIRIATIQLYLNTFLLNFQIIKTGIGKKTTTTLLENINIDNFFKPKKKLLHSTLSKYKYDKYLTFPNNRWIIEDDDKIIDSNCKINDLFDYHLYNNKLIGSILKLKEIKSKIKYIK